VYHAETGVTRITLHELRHTFATQALERGIHPKVVQDILGHASIEMTLDRYSHVSIDLHHAAANALDAGLFGVTPRSAATPTGSDV
jgi:integrase